MHYCSLKCFNERYNDWFVFFFIPTIIYYTTTFLIF
jgi:hypothetical protein